MKNALTVNLAVENVHQTVVRRRRKERKTRMAGDRGNSLAMIAQLTIGLIWKKTCSATYNKRKSRPLTSHVQIKPAHAAIVRTRDDMISTRVKRQTAEPVGASLDLFAHLLCRQIVNTQVALRHENQVGLSRMELRILNISLRRKERGHVRKTNPSPRTRLMHDSYLGFAKHGLCFARRQPMQ